MLSWREAESAFGDVSASNAQPSSGRTNALTSGFALGFTRPHGSPGWHFLIIRARRASHRASGLTSRRFGTQVCAEMFAAANSSARAQPLVVQSRRSSWPRRAPASRWGCHLAASEVVSAARGKYLRASVATFSSHTRTVSAQQTRRRGSTRRPSRGSAPTPPASRASSSEPPRRSHTSTTPAHRSRRNASSTRSSSTSSARPSRAATRPSRSAPRTSCALITPSPTCSTASRPRSPSGRAPRPCGRRRLGVSSFTRAIASSPLEPSTPATPSPTSRPVNVRARSWSSSRATSAGSSTRRSSNG